MDDIDYRINLIIRGMAHLANTPKQLAIVSALAQISWPNAQAFCDAIRFAHVGLIMGPRKLSKRDAASSVVDQLANGAHPRALLHVAMMLGWGHPDPQFDGLYPILDWDDMTRVFPQGAGRPGNALFQPQRLAALTRKYRARPHMVT